MASIPEGGFENGDQLGAWLTDLPDVQRVPFAQVIAHRAALRALPFVHRAFSSKYMRETRRSDLVLTVLRANLVCRVALRHPSVEMKKAANDAILAFGDANAPLAAIGGFSADIDALSISSSGLTVCAAASCISRPESRPVQNALYAVNCSVDPTNRGNGPTSHSIHFVDRISEFWNAIAADAATLAHSADTLALRNSALWPSGASAIWLLEKVALGASLITARHHGHQDGWEIWHEWFEAISEGRTAFGLPEKFAEAIELSIALGDGREGFWQRDPVAINAEIAGWVAEARKKAIPPSHDTDAQTFSQRPAAHQFDQVNGKIAATAIASTAAHKETARDIWEEALAKAKSARARLADTQVPQHVIGTIDRLIEAFGESIEDVRPGILLMRSRSLEADVATLSTPSAHDQFFTDALSLISDLSESVADFRGLFPEILEIEAARIAQQMAESSASETFQFAREVFDFARRSDAVDESSTAALALAHVEITEAELVLEESQSEIVRADAIKARSRLISLHLLDLRNFSAAALKSVSAGAKKVGRDFGGRVYKGALDGTEEIVKAGIKGGAVALAANLAGPLAGLAVLVASFNPLAKRAKEIEQGNNSDGSDEGKPIEV